MMFCKLHYPNCHNSIENDNHGGKRVILKSAISAINAYIALNRYQAPPRHSTDPTCLIALLGRPM